ncbi:MAG TPA: FAD-dependent oxidoreductase [Nocardioides sp.]|jgi:glycine/D-amino acid oxidase-like deaminating enzyme/nitrite reductase/ring-hydroxylating ferredoxin subunit|nr:FAD-dependent oxidoreductase [Nocardioides sp.]
MTATSSRTTSLWRDRAPIETDPEVGERYDDVVVGAGITGLTTALLLARSGRSVLVIEARDVGAVTTGNTTGKVSLLQGTRLSRILERQSERVARAYLEANREGQAWLLRFCDDHDVPYQRRPAVTYAADDDSLDSARDEHDAARRLGLAVSWHDDLGLPFPHVGGTRLENQAQLDAMDVCAALVGEIRREGGVVVTGRRVVGASLTDPSALDLEDGRRVQAENVVLATGVPILDRGLYFAKVLPQRSYAVAFRHPAAPELMLLSAGSPTRSVRDAPSTTGSLLLVGGEGHTVGRHGSTLAHLEALREWTETWFPGAEESHAWSAQDYASHDGLPFIGALPRGRGHVYVATGYGKWGLTMGVAAALSLSKQIHGHQAGWQVPISRRVTRPSGALEMVRLNAEVGLHLVGDFARAELTELREPDEGEGIVGRRGTLPEGRARVDGRTCSVVALCTHLNGTLRWNDAERSWDCPLHGSRFAVDGTVLEGPATRPLRRPS